MQNGLLTIGEFSKITGIPRKTLIYFDIENILIPTYKDDKKCRFYSLQQIDSVNILNLLREFNMPLKEIRSYIDNRNTDSFINILNSTEQKMLDKLERTQNCLEVIRHKKKLIQNSKLIQYSEGITIKHKSTIPLMIKYNENKENPNSYVATLYNMDMLLKENNVLSNGLYAVVDLNALNSNYEGPIAAFAYELDDSSEKVKNYMLPEGNYLCAYHFGPYSETFKTYKKLILYAEENGIKLVGNAYEQDILNAFTEKSPNQFLSEIMIRIKKDFS